MATAPAEDRKQTESSLHAGDILDGRYRVDYLVGRGGMAEVWAGTNERTGKRVALKMLLPSVAASPGADALFHREGLASSRVNHPNVVTVFDVIQHEGAACIVMELLTGEALDVYLARAEQLTLGEVYGLLVPAMRGVAAAHAQGVIHRDLKPQNIFICVGPDGRPVTTKVLDFGISLIRTMDAATPGPSLPMGTPAYMAPEQIAGADLIDERADVYGFGVLFFEALTGEVPFRGPAGSDLYRRIIYDPAPPLGNLRPDLPPGVLRLVDVALAKEPRDRHAGLDTMIALLEAEMTFATPVPGALGPITAGPLPVVPEVAVRATPAPHEAADERQSTRFLVNFPLERAPTQRASVSLTAGTTEPVPRLRAWPARVLAPTWQGMLVVGLAGLAAGIAYVVWLHGGRQAATSPLPGPPAKPASLLVRPSVPMMAAPVPTSLPTASVAEPAATSPGVVQSTLAGPARSVPASEPTTTGASPVAPDDQEAAKPAAKPRRSISARAARGAVPKPEPRRSADSPAPAPNPADPFVPSALAPPPLSAQPLAPKSPVAPKKARPRAGALTADDF